MILRETNEFTIESDVDDEMSRTIADALVDVFSKYRLDDPDFKYGDPIGIDLGNGRIILVVRFKVMNS